MGKTKRLLVGLVGTNGSGKSSVCDFLKNKGFSILSLSDVVREEAKKHGGDLDRDTLTLTGSRLKLDFGHDILAKRCFEISQKSPGTNWVFDSVRHDEELKFLKANGVFFIGLEASMETRYQRIQNRRGSTDSVDFETFKAQCEREYLGQSSGQNIKETLKLCDTLILNNGTLDALRIQIESVLDQLKKEG